MFISKEVEKRKVIGVEWKTYRRALIGIYMIEYKGQKSID